jgi:hypothetical protein
VVVFAASGHLLVRFPLIIIPRAEEVSRYAA